MDGYNPAFVAHNLPYIVVSGLGVQEREVFRKEGGARFTSEIPPVQSEDANTLLKHFITSDATNSAWNGREHTGRNKFKIKTVGREYTLPPRHASPLAATVGSTPTSRPVLHSALSPLSPGSPVFPDGLIDAKWIDKHQDRVPSAFISFYTFTSDANLSTLQDNQLKTDINTMKKVLNDSGYKSRLVIVLLSEKSIIGSSEVEERLSNIRKATGLDSKTSLFFLPPQSSAVELKAFVDTILSVTYPLSIEYYRELSKHARRKRNRGIVPAPIAAPTSGAAKPLSGQGWNVRYDFKLGIFAEFRQEMDAALRSYESGYDLLLSPDVLEAVSNWSPRWNEGRLLADVLAIRILRCHLWAGNSTVAVRWWQQHRENIRDFVDRRGKGSSTYGWQAWEARWATVMGELVSRTGFPEFSGLAMYLPADKTIPTGERMQPWEYLHHPGYWYRTASRHVSARQALAKAIPEEDRSPPGASPASQIASKSYTYDTYLCAEPHQESPLPGAKGVDHSQLFIDVLTRAVAEFKKRKQIRIMQELQLRIAQERLKQESWDEAHKTLRTVWRNMTFRKEGWLAAVEEVCWALRKAAVQTGDALSIISVDWEMMHEKFTHHQNWHYDLGRSLGALNDLPTKPAVVLNSTSVVSFLLVDYAFEHGEAKVGELATCQIIVTSSAIRTAAPITAGQLRIDFEGSMKTVLLRHKDSSVDAKDKSLHHVELSETNTASRACLEGEADLCIGPGQRKVFEFDFLPREAGEANAVSATFSIDSERFDLEYVHTFESTMPAAWWGEKLVKKRIMRQSPATSINILPKPPKLKLKFEPTQGRHYTNEVIMLRVQVRNDEDEDVVARIQVLLLGDEAPQITTRLERSSSEDSPQQSDEETPLSGLPLGKIKAGESSTVLILIPPIPLPVTYDISLKSTYSVVSDLETPIYRNASLDLEIATPFEANYDFAPRVHPDSWPSFFTHNELTSDTPDASDARGLAQRWALKARYFSFAAAPLLIKSASLDVLSSTGNVTSTIKNLSPLPSNQPLTIEPKTLEEASFEISTQKFSLDDRGGATMDVIFTIRWQRLDTTEKETWNSTTLGVPRLLVSSNEPRVLTAVSCSRVADLPLLELSLFIENPSSHFLTFALSVNTEASTDSDTSPNTNEPKLAFSGPQQTTVQLTPYSRRAISFRCVPYATGGWVGPVNVVVKDRYFMKVLRVLGDEARGVRSEKDGLWLWVPSDEEGVEGRKGGHVDDLEIEE